MYTTKADMREYWLRHRMALGESQKNVLSFQIRDSLFHHFAIQRAQHVHVFLPVHERCEVRTWSIVHYVQEKLPQVQLSVPRIHDMKRKEMESVQIEPHTHFIKNKWGIEEPETGSVVPPALLDYILLPLIAFDNRGHRLGYGGGFYDRYLAGCTSAVKIGLSYFEAVEKIPDVESFDIKMDYCITPHRLYTF